VGPGFLTEFEVLPGMGASADGIVSATHYTPVVTNPANEEFIARFQAMRGDNSLPGTYVEAGYLASLVAAEAIEAVGGDLSDNQRFLDALQALEVEGPSGAFHFDERGQGVRDLYIIEVVVNDDGSVTHQVVDVVSEVSQDWTPPQ
jgi:branched-chain amino acid transport system substrate-binding protein